MFNTIQRLFKTYTYFQPTKARPQAPCQNSRLRRRRLLHRLHRPRISQQLPLRPQTTPPKQHLRVQQLLQASLPGLRQLESPQKALRTLPAANLQPAQLPAELPTAP